MRCHLAPARGIKLDQGYIAFDAVGVCDHGGCDFKVRTLSDFQCILSIDVLVVSSIWIILATNVFACTEGFTVRFHELLCYENIVSKP